MKKNIILLLKIVLLTVIMFIGIAGSSVIIGIKDTSQTSDSSLIPVLIYSLINTLILAAFILNSNSRGIKLIASTFIIFWGIQYFMTQIETLYFNYAVKMPVPEVLRVVMAGALNAIIFSISSILILGKFKNKQVSLINKTSLNITFKKSLSSITLLSFAYVIIYFIFGYYVAWQFADLRLYYTGSTDILSVFDHYANQLQTDPILPMFQFIRGILWSCIAMIIINSLKYKNWKTYLISGLLFSILITSPLLFNNAYMPDVVRLGHSFELSTSMLTFGLLSVFILGKSSSFCE